MIRALSTNLGGAAPRPMPSRVRWSARPGARDLAGGDVEPVEDVGRGDSEQERGECPLVVVECGLLPDLVRHRVGPVSESGDCLGQGQCGALGFGGGARGLRPRPRRGLRCARRLRSPLVQQEARARAYDQRGEEARDARPAHREGAGDAPRIRAQLSCNSPSTLPSGSVTVATRRPPPTSCEGSVTVAPAAVTSASFASMSATCQ